MHSLAYALMKMMKYTRIRFLWMKRSYITVLLGILLFSTNHFSKAQGYWDDVDLQVRLGINSFHGDFDTGLNGEADLQGVPFPIDGFNVGVGFSKPISSLRGADYKLRYSFGLDIIKHYSPTLVNSASLNPTGILGPNSGLAPVNVRNTAIGGFLGFSFEYMFTQFTSVEPFFMINGYYHNPVTDGFIDGSNFITSTPTGASKPFYLIDLPYTRNTNEANAYSNFIFAGKAGAKFSTTFSGNNRFFIEYGYMYFLNDYFDNTSEAVINGTSQNDAMTLLTFGLQYPLNSEAATSLETERQIVKVDRKKVAKIERIQNIANLVTSDEDLRELQRIMNDKILLYDTPGVRFNELASKTIQRRVRLADTDIETDMVEVPGGSYIIGLTSVDELNIQVQGRKRITINPFMVDKYEVTNGQYRTFLIAMGAIQPPPQTNPAIPLPNYGTRPSIQELLVKAGLENLSDYVNAPSITTVEDLMPDSLSWSKMGLDEVIPWNIYFYDPFYDDRPVVCVNWYQAKMFAAWAGKRLLTESEWEFAARSGVSGRVYPWDGLDVQTKTGKYRANFKQERGVYDADGYPIMAPVDSYQPNDFGLHNVAGNVSEWVFDSWNPSYVVLQNVGTANFVSPSYNNIREPRRIHRGGSWQSTAFFIGVGVRNFQDASTGTPFVGFRCAKSVTKRFR